MCLTSVCVEGLVDLSAKLGKRGRDSRVIESLCQRPQFPQIPLCISLLGDLLIQCPTVPWVDAFQYGCLNWKQERYHSEVGIPMTNLWMAVMFLSFQPLQPFSEGSDSAEVLTRRHRNDFREARRERECACLTIYWKSTERTLNINTTFTQLYAFTPGSSSAQSCTVRR